MSDRCIPSLSALLALLLRKEPCLCAVDTARVLKCARLADDVPCPRLAAAAPADTVMEGIMVDGGLLAPDGVERPLSGVCLPSLPAAGGEPRRL